MSEDAKFVTQWIEGMKSAERLKWTPRQVFLANGEIEKVGSHTWMMSLMAISLAPKLEQRVNMEKVLKIIAVHDLPEAKTGDLPLWKAIKYPELKKKKNEDETMAINEFAKEIPETGNEMRDLWQEFEELKTPEAKFAKALDKIDNAFQVAIYNDAKRWENEFHETYVRNTSNVLNKYCAHEPVLNEVAEVISQMIAVKMQAAGIITEN